MDGWNDWVTAVCLVLGSFLALTGGVGILRMPDFYSRLHPAGKTDSLGQVLILVGLCFQVELLDAEGQLTDAWLVLARLGMIIVFLALTAPTATHAITKAAWLEGLRPWQRPGDAEGVYTRKHPDKREPIFNPGARPPQADPRGMGDAFPGAGGAPCPTSTEPDPRVTPDTTDGAAKEGGDV